MSENPPRFYKFDSFLFDTDRLQLLCNGDSLSLGHKVAELLLTLLRHRGDVVTKETLMHTLWPQTFVTEANLIQTIYVLRKTLATNAGGKVFIETVKKRGYCFIAHAEEIQQGANRNEIYSRHGFIELVHQFLRLITRGRFQN